MTRRTLIIKKISAFPEDQQPAFDMVFIYNKCNRVSINSLSQIETLRFLSMSLPRPLT
jgi:hypothetical protein